MSSPLFTPAKPKPGQAEIPMGTHHVCPKCTNSHICDVPNCALTFEVVCAPCGEIFPHSEHGKNFAAIQQRLAAEMRRREKPAEYQRDLFQSEMF